MGQQEDLLEHQRRMVPDSPTPEVMPYPSPGLEFNLEKPPRAEHDGSRIPWWLTASQEELRTVRESAASARAVLLRADAGGSDIADMLADLEDFGAAL